MGNTAHRNIGATMYILIITKLDKRGRVYWEAYSHDDNGSAITFHTEAEAERKGNELLNRKGYKMSWFDVQQVG